MAKILILANNDVGLYNFRKELIEELVKKNEVYISLPYGDLVPDLVKLGCIYTKTEFSSRGTNPLEDLMLLTKYINLLRKIKPDAVLTYTIKPNIYGGIACRIMNKKYIPNITGLGTAVENKGMLQIVTLFLYKLAIKKAKCVFFQNRENYIFLNRKITIKKSKLLPGSGVNLEKFTYESYPNDNKIKFIFIARVMKEKGIDQYLDAANYFYEKETNTEFHILGSCDETYQEKLNDYHRKGIIYYHGLQKEVKNFLKDTHCTIHPTYYPEGMSNVLLETAATGRPIITTNRSGCKEIVEEGMNGYFVEQKNSEDLIEKIKEFLNLSYEDKKKMGILGRKKVEREFNRKIVIDQYLSEIK